MQRYGCADGAEEVTIPAMLPVMSRTPGGTKWAGPELGQHTEEVFRELLQMPEAEFRALREQHII